MPPLMPPLMLEGVALASLRGGVLLTVRTRLDRGWLIKYIIYIFDLLDPDLIRPIGSGQIYVPVGSRSTNLLLDILSSALVQAPVQEVPQEGGFCLGVEPNDKGGPTGQRRPTRRKKDVAGAVGTDGHVGGGGGSGCHSRL